MLAAGALSVVEKDGTPISRWLDAPFHDLLVRFRNLIQDVDKRPISKEVAVVGIGDVTARRIGPFGRGAWWTRQPFMQQLHFMRETFKPAVLSYDIIFKETVGTALAADEGAAELTTDAEFLNSLTGTLGALAKEEIEDLDFETLTGMIRLIATQGESFFMHKEYVENLVRITKELFAVQGYSTILVPTYPGGNIGICMGSLGPLLKTPGRHIPEQVQEQLKYYDKQVHEASFVLPVFAQKMMDQI